MRRIASQGFRRIELDGRGVPTLTRGTHFSYRSISFICMTMFCTEQSMSAEHMCMPWCAVCRACSGGQPHTPCIVAHERQIDRYLGL